MKTWKRRWFILTDSCLYYFEFTTVSNRGRERPSAAAAANLIPLQDKDPIGIIPLENLCVRKLQDTRKPVHTLPVAPFMRSAVQSRTKQLQTHQKAI